MKEQTKTENTEPAMSESSTLVSARQISEHYGFGVRTIWKWSKSGIIPCPILIGPRSKRWVFEEVDAALKGYSKMSRQTKPSQ